MSFLCDGCAHCPFCICMFHFIFPSPIDSSTDVGYIEHWIGVLYVLCQLMASWHWHKIVVQFLFFRFLPFSNKEQEKMLRSSFFPVFRLSVFLFASQKNKFSFTTDYYMSSWFVVCLLLHMAKHCIIMRFSFHQRPTGGWAREKEGKKRVVQWSLRIRLLFG